MEQTHKKLHPSLAISYFFVCLKKMQILELNKQQQKQRNSVILSSNYVSRTYFMRFIKSLRTQKGHGWLEDPLLHGEEEIHVKTSRYIKKEYSVRSSLTKD